MEIASYRAVFGLERRLYRIDALRLNPAGVPLRGIAYFVVLVGAVLLLGEIPLVRLVMTVVPWYVRGLLGPAVTAAALTAIRVDGRPFHLTARAVVGFAVASRRLAGLRPCPSLGLRWRPGCLVVLPDGSDDRLRRLRYTGPGTVLVRVAHRRRETSSTGPGRLARRAALVLSPQEAGGTISRATAIALAPGTSLETRSGACPERRP